METADVVIVGGGIVGSSIAWHLTAAGLSQTRLVIERESSQGKGSTGKSMGGVRAQFSTPVNIQMSLYSIPFYAHFDERSVIRLSTVRKGIFFVATKNHISLISVRILKNKRHSGLKRYA